MRADGLSFSSIIGPPYLIFQSHLVLPPSVVLLNLLFVGHLSRLVHFTTTARDGVNIVLTHFYIPLVAWPGRDISGELNHLWILSWCHMDYTSFGSFWLVLWHRADILLWFFGYCPLSSYSGFLELMLCALGIHFFTVYGWWKLKLRYCPVKVGLRYTDDLNPCLVRVTNTSRKANCYLVLSS